jgi:hypothetical protein
VAVLADARHSRLSKKEREAEGRRGGVVRLMYIGILLPKPRKSIFETCNTVFSSLDLDPDFVIKGKSGFSRDCRDVQSC